MGRERGGPEAYGVTGNIKNIAVPVRRGKALRKRANDGIRASCGMEFDRKKTNLLLRRTAHLRTQGAGDQLGAKAKSENRNPESKRFTNHPAFGF